jgi:hypothetical protein
LQATESIENTHTKVHNKGREKKNKRNSSK